VVECLLCTYKGLNSNPSPTKKLTPAVPTTWEAEIGGSQFVSLGKFSKNPSQSVSPDWTVAQVAEHLPNKSNPLVKTPIPPKKKKKNLLNINQ
jgi:hypothetical protein